MQSLLTRHPWLIYLAPMTAYLVLGSFEPTPQTPGGQAIGLAIPYSAYPCVYALKIVATTLVVLLVSSGYRHFPFRMSWRGLAVGGLGAVVWIGLCHLRLEPRLLGPLGLGWLVEQGARSGFNPLVELAATPGWAWTFLALRFCGLVLLVPVVEEFFLRAWVMRFFAAPEWWTVPIGQVNAAAWAAGTLFPVLMHPGEMLAAVAWFSLVTVLMIRTRNIWECVLAHAVTNLLVGLYAVIWSQWQLL